MVLITTVALCLLGCLFVLGCIVLAVCRVSPAVKSGFNRGLGLKAGLNWAVGASICIDSLVFSAFIVAQLAPLHSFPWIGVCARFLVVGTTILGALVPHSPLCPRERPSPSTSLTEAAVPESPSSCSRLCGEEARAALVMMLFTAGPLLFMGSLAVNTLQSSPIGTGVGSAIVSHLLAAPASLALWRVADGRWVQSLADEEDTVR
jgi:hypothetical protein